MQRLLHPAIWVLLLCAMHTGCHRRGYTDLYVESMAAEIRDLEDQLYEYDHEYRLLEQQLDSLRREVVQLRSSPPPASVPKSSNGSTLQFLPRDTLPAPNKNPSGGSAPKGAESRKSILEQPESSRNAPRSSIEEIQPQGIEPEPIEPEPLRRNPNSPPAFPQAPTLPSQGSNNPGSDFDFNIDEITVPSINSGAAKPPSVGPRDLANAPEDDLDVSLSQIDMPAQLAASPAPSRKATLSHATQVVTDTRVVELSFHPNLSRSVNFDDDEQDDGLFLVLVPKNQLGQFVPSAAAMTIEVFDPARAEEHSRIGIWSYSAAEVSGKIQPIGSQQGIHLTLPWNGPNPKADRVLVVAKYTFENGRQLVAHKEIFVGGIGALKTVWAPRAGDANMNGSDYAPSTRVVIPAGAATSVVPSAGSYPSREPAPVPVGPR